MNDLRVTSEGYVQILEPELARLRVHHLTSAVDMSIGMPAHLADESAQTVCGYTEWVGCWHRAEASLGWDWGLVRGDIVLLNAAEIRTNIHVISAEGVPLSQEDSRARLAEWLDTFDWRQVAFRTLAATSS
jgi:Domain of unknown function (DUF4902)